MIRRLFTLLLVLLMLANQGLCLAHAHYGDPSPEPQDHDSRPHFHIGGHIHHDGTHHHDHSHLGHSDGVADSDEPYSAPPSARPPLGEHDSDAVYCGEPVTIARTGKTASVLSERDLAGTAMPLVANQDDGLRYARPLRGPTSSVVDAACPIYLRTLSLRL